MFYNKLFHERWHSPLSGLLPTASSAQMKFLVSVTGHFGHKFSDYMLVLCQKLQYLSYDQQFFSGNQLHLWISCPSLPQLEMLELSLRITMYEDVHINSDNDFSMHFYPYLSKHL